MCMREGLLWRLDEASLLESVIAAIAMAQNKYGRAVSKISIADEPPKDLNLAIEIEQDISTQSGHLFAQFEERALS